MKRKFLHGITLLISLFTVYLTSSSALASGNNWIHGNLRVDLSDVYNANKYDLLIAATGLPTTGTPRATFTTAWLAVWVADDDSGFSQVGLMTFADGVHWFVYSLKGVSNCRGGDYLWGNLGCLGAVNDIVGLNQFHRVMLLKDTDGSWHARVYDTSGTSYDVAKINSTSSRIYKARTDFEEAYVEPVDPLITGKFLLYHPTYYSGGTTPKDWPQSAATTNQHDYLFLDRQINNVADDPNWWCPTYYGANTNLSNDIWYWYAGTGGVRCGWLFPPVTVDDTATSVLTYSGSWSHVTNSANAWNNTLSWGYNPNDKVTLTIPTTNSISRVYSMAYNRGTSNLKVNGSNVFVGNDNTADVRRQVMRTAAATGSTTVEVTDSCCGLVDLDAFIVDTPRVASGTYDDRSYMVNYIGNWTYAASVTGGAYNNTEAWNQNTGDAASFTFTGNSITYAYSTASNRGIAAITIDGVDKGTIDEWSASTVRQVTRTWSSLGSGVHTIHISNTGNTSHTGHFIAVDEFAVP